MYSGSQKHLPSKQLYIPRRNHTGAQTVSTLLTGFEVSRRLILTLFPVMTNLSVCEEAVVFDHLQFLLTIP
jgi:hypothetical protein